MPACSVALRSGRTCVSFRSSRVVNVLTSQRSVDRSQAGSASSRFQARFFDAVEEGTHAAPRDSG